MQRQVATALGQFQRDRTTNPPTRPGNQGNLAFKFHASLPLPDASQSRPVCGLILGIRSNVNGRTKFGAGTSSGRAKSTGEHPRRVPMDPDVHRDRYRQDRRRSAGAFPCLAKSEGRRSRPRRRVAPVSESKGEQLSLNADRANRNPIHHHNCPPSRDRRRAGSNPPPPATCASSTRRRSA